MAVALDELMVSVRSEGADSEEVSLQEQLRLAGELGNALLSDNDRLQREAEELKDIIAELEHERDSITRSHFEELNVVRSTCNAENYELQGRIAELEGELQLCGRKRNELVNGKDRKIRLLEEKIENLEQNLEESQVKINPSCSEQCDSMIESEQLSLWRNKEMELQSQIGVLVQEKADGLDQIVKLKRDLAEAQGCTRALQDQLVETSTQLEQREQDIASLSQELEEMHQVLSDLQDEMEGSQSAKSPLSTNESIFEELMRTEQVVDSSFVPVEPLKFFGQCSRCGQLQEEMVELRRECDRLTQQVLILIEQKFNLSQQIEQWQADVEVMVEDNITRQLKGENQPMTTPPSIQTTPSTPKTWTKRLIGVFS